MRLTKKAHKIKYTDKKYLKKPTFAKLLQQAYKYLTHKTKAHTIKATNAIHL